MVRCRASQPPHPNMQLTMSLAAGNVPCRQLSCSGEAPSVSQLVSLIRNPSLDSKPTHCSPQVTLPVWVGAECAGGNRSRCFDLMLVFGFVRRGELIALTGHVSASTLLSKPSGFLRRSHGYSRKTSLEKITNSSPDIRLNTNPAPSGR